MEQRARVMEVVRKQSKTGQSIVHTLRRMKKKTKKRNEKEDAHGFKCPPETISLIEN